jgi:hypothetical protein
VPTEAIAADLSCIRAVLRLPTALRQERVAPAPVRRMPRESQTGEPRKLLADRGDHTDRYVIISDNSNAHADSIDDGSTDDASGICNGIHGSSRLE